MAEEAGQKKRGKKIQSLPGRGHKIGECVAKEEPQGQGSDEMEVITMQPPIDPKQFINLYLQGRSDHEIAKTLHYSKSAVNRLRLRLGLPVVGNMKMHKGREYQKPCAFTDKMGTPMGKVLSPSQCLMMRDFLHDLTRCYRQKRPGMAMNLASFMREWRKGA